MLSFINKYIKNTPTDKDQEKEEKRKKKKKKDEEGRGGKEMVSSPSHSPTPCPVHACCPSPCLGLTEPTTISHRFSSDTITSTRTSRSNFAMAATSTLFPDIQFTNHESLPSLSDSLSGFNEAYPQYRDTQEADYIREHEYCHLSNHVCLDYTGFNLFSHSQMHPSVASSSTSKIPPFFTISYKSASLTSQVLYGIQETGFESAMRRRIMSFLSISEEDYSMVCTANRTTAFKLLAETYPFKSNKRLLTVYDYDSEAVNSMAESAHKRGARVLSAEFTWPGLRIYSPKLKKILGKRNKKNSGLLVFPLQSRMTGARYRYLWMKLAQENGWHVALDASGLGPKDLDSLGFSLIQPNFIICSFFKVIGENPSGFACLFIKKSGSLVLESSAMARSIGVVSIVPVRNSFNYPEDVSGTLSDIDTTRSFSGPLSGSLCNGSDFKKIEHGETSEPYKLIDKEGDEIVELESNKTDLEIECIGLDHADSLGLLLISSRVRCITNWLVIALMKLRHPNSENGHPLVRIYGPRVKFERGPSIAFNVFDWKGEKIEPSLVQKLADRSSISLSCGFLKNIWFSDKYEEEKEAVSETRIKQINVSGNKRKEEVDVGIQVVNASLGFLSNFEDAYKLWSFIAKFLDADFVEKERWRYMALNQTMIEV